MNKMFCPLWQHCIYCCFLCIYGQVEVLLLKYTFLYGLYDIYIFFNSHENMIQSYYLWMRGKEIFRMFKNRTTKYEESTKLAIGNCYLSKPFLLQYIYSFMYCYICLPFICPLFLWCMQEQKELEVLHMSYGIVYFRLGNINFD